MELSFKQIQIGDFFLRKKSEVLKDEMFIQVLNIIKMKIY